MFAQEYSQNLLKECASATMNQTNPDLMTKLIQFIDQCGGLVFGSTIAAYLLRDSTLNGKHPKDMDILFRDQVSYERFIDTASKEIEKTFKSSRYSCDIKISQSEPFYEFNDLICSEENAETYIKVVVREKHASRVFATLKMHLVYIRSGGSPDSTSIIPEKYVGFLFERFFKIDFTKTVYYKGKIYSHLSTINVVSVQPTDVTSTTECIINKYSGRGIKFLLAPPQSVIEPVLPKLDLSTLDTAKSSYRSLGFAVIALRRNDRDQAGKSPCERDWMNKTRDHDCDTSRCDNIGIVCGPNSGIVCIDVDMKDDGMKYFQKLVDNYGMPSCPTQETPNGGRHFIFKYNSKMTGMKARIKGAKLNGKKLGIDLWIDRCQFVAEPSINRTNNKMYKWTTPLSTVAAIPELPEWIYDLYFNTHITEDGWIIPNDKDAPFSDTSSLTSDTPIDISPITSPTPVGSAMEKKIPKLVVPELKHMSEVPSVVFQLDTQSAGSYMMLIMLSLLFIFVVFVMLLGLLAGIAIAVIIPKEHKFAIRAKTIRSFEACVNAFK